MLCCEFYEAEPGDPETTMSRMRCVTGTGDGNVLLWRNMSTGDDCMMQVIKKLMYQPEAKLKTTKMLPAHTKNCSAVRVRIKRDKKSNSLVTDIISGGSGGLLQVWRHPEPNPNPNPNPNLNPNPNQVYEARCSDRSNVQDLHKQPFYRFCQG